VIRAARPILVLAGLLLFSVGFLTATWVIPNKLTSLHPSEAAAPIVRLDTSAPLEQVISDLARQYQQNVVVHWDMIERMGVPRTLPIRVRIEGVPFPAALESVLAVANQTLPDPDRQLDSALRDNVYVVTSKEELIIGGVLRIYDIRDLPRLWLGTAVSTSPATQPENADYLTWNEWVDQLVTFIERVIDPETWKNNGGWIGSSYEIGGLLVIVQTPENYERIARLLQELRTGRGPHIHHFPSSLPLSRPLGR
jgi:hypothetical protein